MMEIQTEELYRRLLDNIAAYHPSADLSLVREAFLAAESACDGRTLLSGEPCIDQPLGIALILSELKLDKESIAAALLYTAAGEGILTDESIKVQFGEEIAFLTEGVTRLGRIGYAADRLESQAENFRKMFLAMSRDIRVILIKLADRLYEMRSLKYQVPARQKEIAKETLEIYAPIAQRLGISMISMELEDLALKYLYPEVYYDLANRVELTKTERQQFIDQMIEKISAQLEKSHVEASVSGRFKHFFSIYRKMVNRNKTLDDMYDLFAIRITVDTIKECYAVLGMIHELYKPIPGRFKDYISMPKSNMYQSLHTTVLDTNGQSFEIQIRTREMHRTAEYGIAAHWKYKEGKTEGLILNEEEEKLNWLKQVLEWQMEMSDNREFMSLIKTDFNLMSESIYCFTPRGDVKNLKRGSNVIDFAYSIHSAVGNQMVGARVNGDAVPFEYEIQNGDRVEILTSQNSEGPSVGWLKLVKTAQARNKINQWFREAKREDNIQKGEGLLKAYCEKLGVPEEGLCDADYRDRILRRFGYRDWDSVLAAVGHGALKESQIVNRMSAAGESADSGRKAEKTGEKKEDKDNREDIKENGDSGAAGDVIIGDGKERYSIRFSKCCSPVPGDEIIAFVTKGRGVTIHRTDCVNIIKLPGTERYRLYPAEWSAKAQEKKESYVAGIQILAGNRIGILADVSGILADEGMNVSAMDCKLHKQGYAVMNVSFEVRNRESLDGLVKRLMQIEGIAEIKRTNG